MGLGIVCVGCRLRPHPQEQVSSAHGLKTLGLWVLFCICFGVVGCGLGFGVVRMQVVCLVVLPFSFSTAAPAVVASAWISMEPH